VGLGFELVDKSGSPDSAEDEDKTLPKGYRTQTDRVNGGKDRGTPANKKNSGEQEESEGEERRELAGISTHKELRDGPQALSEAGMDIPSATLGDPLEQSSGTRDGKGRGCISRSKAPSSYARAGGRVG
jgi:hypothetical protein